MIKRTLYFENPAYISTKQSQLIIKMPDAEKNLPKEFSERFSSSIAIEDIGIVILDNQQITITQGTIQALLENNCSVIICDANRMPAGLLLTLSGNTLQGERYKHQISSSLPLRKQLWQQTIQSKVANQASLLKVVTGNDVPNMQKWIKDVKSGDTTNIEARAAVYYWANLFPKSIGFSRDRSGMPPNQLLNYGYAILRAVITRSLVSSGLLPSLGIHHKNRYNSFALADDIMEPYRPFVDRIIVNIINSGMEYNDLTKDFKIQLLSIPVIDVEIDGLKRPLSIAAGITTSSLYKCFSKEDKIITYPILL